MELETRGLDEKQMVLIEKYLSVVGTNEECMRAMKDLLGNNETGQKGLEELQYLLNVLPSFKNASLLIDFTLARGLNYYTGIIFEVKAKNAEMGSIGGGGRYDDLTGLFGMSDIPGVGISFGVDRIYDVMEELHLFPSAIYSGTQVLFFNLGDEESKTAFFLMQKLRAKNVRCELFHETAKFEKQFKYAEKKSIRYVLIIGSKELEAGSIMVRDLEKKLQQEIQQDKLVEYQFE